jgi:hypothetical protein
MKEESPARWAAGADPCTAVRRRENLRSASFRDYAMQEPLAREASIKRPRATTGRDLRSETAR